MTTNNYYRARCCAKYFIQGFWFFGFCFILFYHLILTTTFQMRKLRPRGLVMAEPGVTPRLILQATLLNTPHCRGLFHSHPPASWELSRSTSQEWLGEMADIGGGPVWAKVPKRITQREPFEREVCRNGSGDPWSLKLRLILLASRSLHQQAYVKYLCVFFEGLVRKSWTFELHWSLELFNFPVWRWVNAPEEDEKTHWGHKTKIDQGVLTPFQALSMTPEEAWDSPHTYRTSAVVINLNVWTTSVDFQSQLQTSSVVHEIPAMLWGNTSICSVPWPDKHAA